MVRLFAPRWGQRSQARQLEIIYACVQSLMPQERFGFLFASAHTYHARTCLIELGVDLKSVTSRKPSRATP